LLIALQFYGAGPLRCTATSDLVNASQHTMCRFAGQISRLIISMLCLRLVDFPGRAAVLNL
ncbi:hypothetical protein HPB47_010323, partial [Ixodes persulcatus]